MESLAVAARFLLYVGVLVAIGEVGLAWSRADSWRAPPEERTRTYVVAAWCSVLFALLLMFAVQFVALELAPNAADVAMLVRQTTWGHGWSLLAACAVVGAIATVVRARLAVRAAVALGIAMAMGGLGHAAADEVPALSRTLDALHVLAIGTWLGTLLLIDRSPTLALWTRFSQLASVAAPLTVVSGLGASLRHFWGIAPGVILASAYGQALLWKIAVVAGVLLLGAWHRRRVQAQQVPSLMSVRVELGLTLWALTITAVLTGLAPPGM